MVDYIYDTWLRKMNAEPRPGEQKKFERQYLRDVPSLGIPTVRARALEEHVAPRPAVYFVLAPLINRVKIGHSRGVAARFAGLKECAPEAFVFLGWVPGGYAVERRFHEVYSDLRAHGEWFNATPELRARFSKAYGIVWPEDPLFS